MPTAELLEVNPSFAESLPLTSEAVPFAVERHAGRRRGNEGARFVHHPLEVAALLDLAGYSDAVVASGALHDVLEDTDTGAAELVERFGTGVATLVEVVSEDSSIRDREARKSALRARVARGPIEAAAVFAADKVSKTRELRSQLRFGLRDDEAYARLDHYRASLSMLERRLGRRHMLVEQLRFELELVSMLISA